MDRVVRRLDGLASDIDDGKKLRSADVSVSNDAKCISTPLLRSLNLLRCCLQRCGAMCRCDEEKFLVVECVGGGHSVNASPRMNTQGDRFQPVLVALTGVMGQITEILSMWHSSRRSPPAHPQGGGRPYSWPKLSLAYSSPSHRYRQS